MSVGTGAQRATDVVLALAEHLDLYRDGEDGVLLAPGSPVAHRLNPVATVIAEQLSAPTTIASVCEQVLMEFDVPPEDCATTVGDFADLLLEQGMAVRHDDDAVGVGLRRRYLDLLKRALVNLIYPEHELRMELLERTGPPGGAVEDQRRLRDLRYTEPQAFAELVAAKREGRVWRHRIGRDSHTVVGLGRLANLERCAAHVFSHGVPGDFLEAGVCRGGASIFLRALQVAYGHPDRRTWVADSFTGVPPPTSAVDIEHGLDLSEPQRPWLAARQEEVRDNFRTYGLLTDEVRFLPGWFAETLPSAPIERLALLRIDADLYSSTREVLDTLYGRLSAGGFVVVDDYWVLSPCRRAVDEFLAERGDGARLRRADWNAAYWQKPTDE